MLTRSRVKSEKVRRVVTKCVSLSFSFIVFLDSDFDFFIELTRVPLNAKPASVIGKAMNILRQNGNFTNFLPISHARVPILKCYHIRTGYQCDINFSDSYGILNSPIVARLLTFDARIYVVATILKYWTKVHDCAGKNRISNYAIVWMLLFYLQQMPNPIVPPIYEFQKRVPPYHVNGYNFAFDERVPNQTTNQSRCSELLRGFFKFYSEFEYETQIISPLFGKAFRKSHILAKTVPELAGYYELLSLNPNLSPMQLNKRICIQDPFEITHSIPGVIANLEFQKILCKFEYAAEIIDSELRSNGESTKLLLLLFDAEKFTQYSIQKIRRTNDDAKQQQQQIAKQQQTAVFRSQNAASLKTVLNVKPTDYHLSIVREILTKKNTETNTKIDSQAIHRSWSEYVVEFIVLILRDIFMLKIENGPATEMIQNGTETPSTSVAAEPNDESVTEDAVTTDDDQERFTKVLNVSGARDVFLGRKQTKKITIHSLHAEMLDSQERVKNTAWEIQLKASVKIATDINSFDNVTIELEDQIKTKKNNSFKTFFTNFDQNLNNLLKIYFVHKSGNTDQTE